MIRSCRGGGGPRSTGRLVARLSTLVTVSPGRSGEVGGGASAVDVGGSAPPVPAPVGADARASTTAGGPGAGRAGGLGRCPVALVIVARARFDVRPSNVLWPASRGVVAGTRVDGAGDGREATRAPEADGAGVARGDDDGVRAGRRGGAVEGAADGVGSGTADGSGSGSVDGSGRGRGTTAVGRGRGTIGCASTTSATEPVMAFGEAVTSISGRRDGDGVSAWAGSAPRAAPSATAPSATGGGCASAASDGGRRPRGRQPCPVRLTDPVSLAEQSPLAQCCSLHARFLPRQIAGYTFRRYPDRAMWTDAGNAPGRVTPGPRWVSARGRAAGHAADGSASTGR